MLAKPYMPANSDRTLLTGLPNLSATQIKHNGFQTFDYTKATWQNNIVWQSLPSVNGKVLAIELAQHKNTMHYRYFANDNSQNIVFEPWSSSKIMPITAAMAKVTEHNVVADFNVGEYLFSDLITSVHSYDEEGAAKGDSNAIATYFANQVGRQTLTALFHNDWLKLNQQDIFFRGAYGQTPLTPEPNLWHSKFSTITPNGFTASSDDPFYWGYRCDECGLTGNKAMTTLALAEWLKRLVVNQRDKSAALPALQKFDMSLLFYGSHQAPQPEGMMAGISRLLAHSIASHIAPLSEQDMLTTDKVTAVLNKATQGQWRIFQKVGWGYSETRTAGEMIYLAHISLPNYLGGKEFTIAAQSSIPGKDEANLYAAGRNMQTLLNETIKQVLGSND